MENLKQALETIKGSKYESTNNKLKQTHSNEVKRLLMTSIREDLAEYLEIDFVKGDGLAIEIPNDEDGTIYATLDIKMKPLDYDFEIATQEYKDHIKAKEEVAQEKTKAKQAKVEKDKRLRELKAKEKELKSQ